jgi:hypothetical protein
MSESNVLPELKDRLYLYNTLSKDKQLFTAIDADKKTVSSIGENHLFRD